MIRGSQLAHQRARRLRREMTKPERLLWGAIRANRTGWHFRRQHAAGPYILDFYCHAAGLCVEVDGEQHSAKVAYDRARDAFLAARGIRVLRVAAREVLEDLPGVLAQISASLPTHPSPAATHSLKGRGESPTPPDRPVRNCPSGGR
jgi:very-short-patch-repair endonuclease